MGKLVNCECGEVVRGDTDADLLAAINTHLNRDHPELVGKVNPQDILSMAEEEN